MSGTASSRVVFAGDPKVEIEESEPKKYSDIQFIRFHQQAQIAISNCRGLVSQLEFSTARFTNLAACLRHSDGAPKVKQEVLSVCQELRLPVRQRCDRWNV